MAYRYAYAQHNVRAELIAARVLIPSDTDSALGTPRTPPTTAPVLRLDDLGRAAALRHIQQGGMREVPGFLEELTRTPTKRSAA